MNDRWYSIENVEIKVLESGIVPVRMTLTRNDGTIVTSAGWDISGAATLLFSTAGFGRHVPRALRNKIGRLLGDETGKKWVNNLLSELSMACVG